MAGIQPKTIKKVLSKKIGAWLESIEDEKVRRLAKRDVIVTGGSIASMLLGEKVNDFDVYFKTLETTVEVAKYYCEKMQDSSTFSPNVKVEEKLNANRVEEKRVIIWNKSSGVAVADEQREDFQGMTDASMKEIISGGEEQRSMAVPDDEQETVEDTGEKKPYRVVFMSDNAITLSDKVQIIVRFYGKPDELHTNYDFVHAMNWYTYDDNHLELKVDAMSSLMSKRLKYVGSLYPICSLFRMRKFMERGWYISASEILKMAMQVSNLDLTDLDILREQLVGVDMAYFHTIITIIEAEKARKELLGEPLEIDHTYVGTIIDKVFGE